MDAYVIASSRQNLDGQLEASGMKINKNLKHEQVELSNLDL